MLYNNMNDFLSWFTIYIMYNMFGIYVKYRARFNKRLKNLV